MNRAADPVIDLFLEDQKNNTVLVCLVKREGYKVFLLIVFNSQGNPDHPYRTHPLIKLQSIPTLIQFKNGKEVGRCVERECRNEDSLYALMDQIVCLKKQRLSISKTLQTLKYHTLFFISITTLVILSGNTTL